MFVIDGETIQVLVEQKSETEVSVTTRSESKISKAQETITAILQKMLGTGKNLEEFYKHA